MPAPRPLQAESSAQAHEQDRKDARVSIAWRKQVELDLFAPGYGNASIFAILLVGLGGGLGLQWARRWQQSRYDKE
ncbi:MAG: hypothetical protein WCL01_02420 [Comamonadaceae bacterium]